MFSQVCWGQGLWWPSTWPETAHWTQAQLLTRTWKNRNPSPVSRACHFGPVALESTFEEFFFKLKARLLCAFNNHTPVCPRSAMPSDFHGVTHHSCVPNHSDWQPACLPAAQPASCGVSLQRSWQQSRTLMRAVMGWDQHPVPSEVSQTQWLLPGWLFCDILEWAEWPKVSSL